MTSKRTILVATIAISLLVGGGAWANEERSSDVVKINVPKCAAPAKKLLLGTVTCRASACRAGQNAQAGGLGALAMLIAQSQGGAGSALINAEGLSSSLADMLSNSLRETGCFDIVDKESLDEVKKQMESLGKKFEGADDVDLIVSGSISSVGITHSSRHVVIVNSHTTRSELTFDAKVIDAKSGKVVGGGTYSAKSVRSSSGVDLGIVRTGNSAGFAGTPLEEVAREAIVRATSEIVTRFAQDNITSTTEVQLRSATD